MSIEGKLKEIVAKGKITGSWLFCGPFGVGKHKTATGLANYLATGIWCETAYENPQIMRVERSLTEEAKKEIQKTILAGQAIEENEKTQRRKQEIAVEDIRAGIHFLSLKPGANEYRILILSLAEEMNPNAANALLKILEEPFERSVLILITENAGKLLPTICSRCRRIDFPLLSQAEIEQGLYALCPDPTDRAFIASLAEGSLGKAQLIYENNGLELYQRLSDFMSRSLNDIPIESLNAFADTVLKSNESYRLFQMFFTKILVQSTKEEMHQQNQQTENLTDFYFQTLELFKKTDLLYLDKKQNMINLILRYAEEFQG